MQLLHPLTLAMVLDRATALRLGQLRMLGIRRHIALRIMRPMLDLAWDFWRARQLAPLSAKPCSRRPLSSHLLRLLQRQSLLLLVS